MRALKIATIIMGVLIVLGTTALIIGVVRRSASPTTATTVAAPSLPVSIAAVLDEPVGTHILGVVSVRDRLAIQLQGGGLDRVVLLDPTTGAVTGRISLAR
jgi:hypothetical protein